MGELQHWHICPIILSFRQLSPLTAGYIDLNNLEARHFNPLVISVQSPGCHLIPIRLCIIFSFFFSFFQRCIFLYLYLVPLDRDGSKLKNERSKVYLKDLVKISFELSSSSSLSSCTACTDFSDSLFPLLYIDLRPGQAVKIGNTPVKITGASGWGISEYKLDRGRVEWVQSVTPTKRRWTTNYYITRCTGSSISWRSDKMKIRCGRENQHPAEWAPVEQPRWTGKKRYGK